MVSPAGKLTVTTADGGVNKSFTVDVQKNLKITNFNKREFGKAGDIQADIQNGKTHIKRVTGGGSEKTNLSTMDLRVKRYNIFDALRKLDGNAEDLTPKDLQNVDKLDKQNLGIKAIRKDAQAGITTIVCSDDAVLKFDFEI